MIKSRSDWSPESIELADKLHRELSIDHNNWHRLKGNHERRAAELISASLVQLINGGSYIEVEELNLQGLKWLKNEIKDPGCSRH